MGDNDDDSLDTYFASDDDLIRGSGYKSWPDTNKEPICSTPSFYRKVRVCVCVLWPFVAYI